MRSTSAAPIRPARTNRNLARMALLLAGLPDAVPGMTVNRLCASGMDAVAAAARAIKSSEIDLAIAGGSESMTRAPFVMGKGEAAFQRSAELFDTTIGWRFVNPLMKTLHGVDSMPETAQNVADDYQVSREDQDAFALRSQQRAAAAQARGTFGAEILPMDIKDRKGGVTRVAKDEHPRADATIEALAKLKGIVRPDGSVTAGNASGVNDGAAALILASGKAVEAHGLRPIARVLGFATAGVAPRVMGVGPIPAVRKLCERLKLTPASFDVIELNEAFASQALACLRGLGLPDDGEHVNPNGGAIALGHPLGMSGGPHRRQPRRSSFEAPAEDGRSRSRCAWASVRGPRSPSSASDRRPSSPADRGRGPRHGASGRTPVFRRAMAWWRG